MTAGGRREVGIIYAQDEKAILVNDEGPDFVYRRRTMVCLIERYPAHVCIEEYVRGEFEFDYDFDGPYVTDSWEVRWTKYLYGPCDGSCKKAVEEGAQVIELPEELCREIPEKPVIWRCARHRDNS